MKQGVVELLKKIEHVLHLFLVGADDWFSVEIEYDIKNQYYTVCLSKKCQKVHTNVLRYIEHGDDKAVTTKNRFEALGEKFLGSLEEEKTVIVGGGRAGRRNKIGRRTKNSKGPNHCSKRGQNQGRKRKKTLQKTLIVIEIPGQAKSS